MPDRPTRKRTSLGTVRGLFSTRPMSLGSAFGDRTISEHNKGRKKFPEIKVQYSDPKAVSKVRKFLMKHAKKGRFASIVGTIGAMRGK